MWLLVRVRRMSAWVRLALTVALLAGAYWLVLGLFAVGFRLFGRKAAPGWIDRRDPSLAAIARLQAPF
jgi:hypothetical protein